MKTLYLVVASVVVGGVGVCGYSHTPVQYHIQTDEGPDRYFRFQTYNGQYRKEKRLEDGTVVGTYGWVDAVGILRLYDYIADTRGYRIVRQRTMKVSIPTLPPLTTTTTPTPYTPPITPPTPPPIPPPENPSITNLITPTARPRVPQRPRVQHSHATLRPTRTHAGATGMLGGSRTSNRGGSRWGSRRRTPTSRPQLLRPQSQTDVIKIGVVREKTNNVVEAGTGNLPPGGTVSINYDLGNQFHFEKIYPDGTKVGRHGYVDPLGILRVSHYSAGPAGHTQRQESHWVGSRAPAST